MVEKHAWNVLQINEKIFPVDLTWDSGRFQRGEKGLEYFGCKRDFEQTHNKDENEKQYRFSCFAKEDINRIDTTNTIEQKELSEEDKKMIIHNVIEETYKKFELGYGSEKAKIQVNMAIMNYIEEGKIDGFTRQNNAREGIKKYITQEDMINLLISEYVSDLELSENKSNDVLATSIRETSNKYGKQQANSALKRYILESDIGGFTRQNGARSNMDTLMTSQVALEKIIREMVDREVSAIEKNIVLKENNTQILQKMYFDAGEFEEVQLPVKKGLIKEAMEWIKKKTIERRQNNDIRKVDTNKDIQRQEIKEQNER